MEERITLTPKDTQEVTGVYDKENLDLNILKEKPILKPLLEVNNSFKNFELVINKALWEFQENKEDLDKLIKDNPRYSETILLARVQNILVNVKQIIHSQDIQKKDMKKAIEEMVKITSSEYSLNQPKEPLREGLEKPKKISEISDENKKVKVLEKDTNFHSDLVEKTIPKPKKEEFIPIGRKKINGKQN